jgi:hypothetical protein
MAASFNFGLEPSGRELLVIVIKGTFRIPLSESRGQFSLHDEQVPLVTADVFSGEPGATAPVYEMDFAPRKLRCEVLLNGSAYAPNGRPTTRVEVGIQVNQWSKRLASVGPRQWTWAATTTLATSPAPFVRQPVSYDVAFGGVDVRHKDPAQHAAYMLNPVGKGFYKHLRREWIQGAPLPLTEELGTSVTSAGGRYTPMAFGPIGRNWEPRYRFAGTYDEEWMDNHFPFLPPDFDPLYFQSAPADQQLPPGFFDRGVEVVLTNLTPAGRTRFTIPPLAAPVMVFPKHGTREDYLAALDTLLIEPDEGRYCLTWRLARPLKYDAFEISRVQVGKKGREWWQSTVEAEAPVPVSAPAGRS